MDKNAVFVSILGQNLLHFHKCQNFESPVTTLVFLFRALKFSQKLPNIITIVSIFPYVCKIILKNVCKIILKSRLTLVYFKTIPMSIRFVCVKPVTMFDFCF